MTKSQRGSVLHQVQIYEKRPTELEHVTFMQYFSEYCIKTKEFIGAKHTVYRDQRDPSYPVIREASVVRTSNFHPVHQLQGFFYTMLLRASPSFRGERELLTGDNKCYFTECVTRGYVNTAEKMHAVIDDYSKYQMLGTSDVTEIVSHLCGMTDEDEDGLLTVSSENLPAHQQNIDMDIIIQAAKEQVGKLQLQHLPDDSQYQLNEEQQLHVDQLSSSQCRGIHVLSGVPGSGKTLCTKLIAQHHLNQGRSVLMSATTGAAASQLSPSANTVHHSFAIGFKGQYMSPLFETDAMFHKLKEAKVFIIDEMSMLTQFLFSQVLSRIEEACGENFMEDRLIILVGDHCQLPPVCHHRNEPGRVCDRCHLSSSMYWPKMQWHHLRVSVRQCSDPDYLAFLAQIREGSTTQADIDRVLHARLRTDASAQAELLKEDITVLCSHNEDVNNFNMNILSNKFPASELIQLGTWTNLTEKDLETPELRQFANEHDDNMLPAIAIGCPVVLKTNKNVPNGASNGARATVIGVSYTKGHITGIQIRINATGFETSVTRTRSFHKFYNMACYTVKWALNPSISRCHSPLWIIKWIQIYHCICVAHEMSYRSLPGSVWM